MSWISTAALTSGGTWKWPAIGLGALVLIGLLIGMAAWRGYNAGYSKAEALWEADVAALERDHALALAKAEATARELLQEAEARTAAVEADYLAAQRTIAGLRQKLTNGRILDASRDIAFVDGRVLFGPSWVRLYNEAIGACAGDGCDAQPDAAVNPDGAPGTGQAVGPGVFPDGTSVTSEDILAHISDYGTRCQHMEAQVNGFIDWAEGLDTREVRQ